MTMSAFWKCGAAIASLAGAMPAWAQDTAPANDDTGISDIIVTAQRRSEPLQRAAVAVDVVSSEALLQAGVSKATDLAALVPSLQISSAGGSTTSFYIRGVGAFTANSYSDAAVAFNYDGVYVSRPAASSGVFYDLERVEVLKGPQGTLYGRNATGGAINVLPAKPKLGEFSGFANAGYGNYGALNLQGAVNVPISATAALRFAGSLIDRKGYMSDGTDDDKGDAARLQLLLEPSDIFSIRLAGDYYHQHGKGAGASFSANSAFNPFTGTYSAAPSGLSTATGAFDPLSAVFLSHTFSGLPGRTLTALPGQPKVDNTTWGINAELNWKSPLGTFTLIPAYREFKENVTAAGGGFTTVTRDTDRQFSVEARLASDSDDRLSWVLGGFYYHDTVDAPDFRVLMQVLDSFQVYQLKTESVAGFARLSYKVTDRFRFVAGGRYTRDHRSMDGTADVILDVCTAPTHSCPGAPLLPFASSVANTAQQLGLISVNLGNTVFIQPANPAAANTIFLRGITAINQSRSDGQFTYRLGAEFDAGPQSLLYATYETGFRSGGFAFAAFKPTFGPEKIEAWTIGSKNRFFDNRLQLNVEAFLWKYKDQQVTHLGPDPQLGVSFFTENIGRSTNKGFEVELQYQPNKKIRFFADAQYLRARLNSFAYQVPAVSGGNPSPPPNTACAVTPPAAFTPTSTYGVNCSGRSAFRSPEWTINFGAEKTFRIGDFEIVANASTHYQSANFIGFEFLADQLQPSYWMSNASLTFQPALPSWSVTAYINNIENKRRANLGYYNDPTSTYAKVYSAPQTYGVRINYEF